MVAGRSATVGEAFVFALEGKSFLNDERGSLTQNRFCFGNMIFVYTVPRPVEVVRRDTLLFF